MATNSPFSENRSLVRELTAYAQSLGFTLDKAFGFIKPIAMRHNAQILQAAISDNGLVFYGGKLGSKALMVWTPLSSEEMRDNILNLCNGPDAKNLLDLWATMFPGSLEPFSYGVKLLPSFITRSDAPTREWF